MATYFDTDTIPYFSKLRFLAVGKANWDYFLSPTCPWVYSIAKVEGCRSTAFGMLSYWLDAQKRHALTNYVPPLPAEMRVCANPPVRRGVYGVYACCPNNGTP